MPPIPLGAELNLGLQLSAMALLIAGFYLAFHAHRRTGPAIDLPGRAIFLHMNVMTLAITLAGVGLLVWMLPNLLLGWYYAPSGLGYGQGGIQSYFELGSGLTPHWYVLVAHLALGLTVAALALYLLLRMRWPAFPRRLAVVNFRRWMQVTWLLWIVNVAIGLAVFYFFVWTGTG